MFCLMGSACNQEENAANDADPLGLQLYAHFEVPFLQKRLIFVIIKLCATYFARALK